MHKQLVIQLARMGDIIQTKRLILSLARQGELHLCVDTSLQAFAAQLYPDVCVHALSAHGGTDASVLRENYALFERLRQEKFDLVYNLNHAGVNRACARLFDVERVRGYRMYNDQSLHDPLLRLAFRWMQNRRCAPLHLADLWAFLADAPLPPAEVNPVAHGEGRGIGIVLAGRHARRSLSPTLLAPCVHTLFQVFGGAPIFFFGSQSEHGLARACMDALPGTVREACCDLAGKTGLTDLSSSLEGLDCVLSPDTGLLHLAAHLGVPTLGLFLSSAWCFETGAYGLGHTVWQAALPCAPCLESASCTQNVACARLFEGRGFLHPFAQIAGQLLDPKKNTTGMGSLLHPNISFPPDLLLMHSALDSLGSIWEMPAGEEEAGTRRDTVQRHTLRHLLKEFLGCDTAGLAVMPRLASVADALYEETDWILPWYAHS